MKEKKTKKRTKKRTRTNRRRRMEGMARPDGAKLHAERETSGNAASCGVSAGKLAFPLLPASSNLASLCPSVG